jgi:hypothetical protein
MTDCRSNLSIAASSALAASGRPDAACRRASSRRRSELRALRRDLGEPALQRRGPFGMEVVVPSRLVRL